MTLSSFSDQAIAEAREIGVELVDGRTLSRRLEAVRRAESCPGCETAMLLGRQSMAAGRDVPAGVKAARESAILALSRAALWRFCSAADTYGRIAPVNERLAGTGQRPHIRRGSRQAALAGDFIPLLTPASRCIIARSVGETGFEPATARPPAGCATRLRHSPWLMTERATGIEPALEAWKASVQPQHFARSGRRPIYCRSPGAPLLDRHLARSSASPAAARARTSCRGRRRA